MDKFFKWIATVRAEFSRASAYTELSLCTSDGTSPFAAGMGELIKRHRLLGRFIAGAWVSFTVAALVAVICLGMASVVGPDHEISSIDVPKHIQSLFDAQEQPDSRLLSGGTSGGTGSLSSALEGVVVASTTILKAFGGLMLMGGIFSAVIRQSFHRSIAGLLGGLMMMTLPDIMVSTLETVDESSSSRASYSQLSDSWQKAISDADYAGIATILGGNSAVDGGAKAYILAQAAIVVGKDSPEMMTATVQRLRNPEEGKTDRNFKIPGQVAYTIEIAADGRVVSEQGRAYLSLAEGKAAPWKSVGSFFNCLGLLISLVMLTATALRLLIKARLSRLDELLSQLA